MAGHTMGPWSVGAFNSSSDEVEIVTGDLMTVANVLGPGRVDEQTLADAHLIAAAPDLLAACTDAEMGIREAVRIMDLMGRGQDARNLAIHCNNLRAAIAKAEAA